MEVPGRPCARFAVREILGSIMDEDGRRLGDSALWRQVRTEPRFAWALGFVLACAGALFLSVLPMWPVGAFPGLPGFRLSGLARLESRLESRRVRGPEGQTEPSEVLRTLRTALAWDPTNLDALRSSLARRRTDPHPTPAEAGHRIREALWLLRVSRTNRHDARMVLGILEELGADELVPALVSGLPGPVPEENEAALRALMRLGDPRFLEWRRRLGPAAPGTALEVLDHAAAAFWSPDPERSRDAAAALGRVARDDPDPRNGLAARLAVLLQGRRGGIVEHRDALELATRRGVARPRRHAEYWRRLHREGRTAEAAGEASRFRNPPGDLWEAVFLAETWAELGWIDDGLRYLELHAAGAEPAEVAWRCRSRLLADSGRWHDLLGLALAGRQGGVGTAAVGETLAAEAWALWNLGRSDEARTRFRCAVEAGFEGTVPATMAAERCRRSGHLALALDLLLAAEPFPEETADHWDRCFRLAMEIGDAESVRHCAEEGRRQAGNQARMSMNRILAIESQAGAPAESLVLLRNLNGRNEVGEEERRLAEALALNRLGLGAAAWARLDGIQAPQGEPMAVLAASEALLGLGFAGEALAGSVLLDPEALPGGFLTRWEALERRIGAALECAEENRN